MWPLILWTLAVLSESMAKINFKKALVTWNISKIWFKIIWLFFTFFIYLVLIKIFWFEINIFENKIILILIVFCWLINFLESMTSLMAYQNTKLSNLIPYENLDKLFIVVIGFFIYIEVPWQEISIATLAITILTIIIISLFSFDFKRWINFDENISIFLLNRILKATNVIIIWFILMKYSAITYWSLNLVAETIIYLVFAILFKTSITYIFKQSSIFYKYRLLWIVFWASSFILWLIIIEKTGIIIASLLGFLGIFFSIINMELILKDKPSTKQTILAFIVISMISLWYYFK